MDFLDLFRPIKIIPPLLVVNVCGSVVWDEYAISGNVLSFALKPKA